MVAMTDVTLDPCRQNDSEFLQYDPESEATSWTNTQPQDPRVEGFPAPDFSSLGLESVPALDCRDDGFIGPMPMGVGRESTRSVDLYHQDIKDSGAVSGCTGIHNLGNTCFMNAGLQCLVSNSALAKYFLEEHHHDSDDTTSLTGQFALVLRKVWCGDFSTIQTTLFKQVLAMYYPQFNDHRQHDCQEFLALLLDSLHEQLNEGSPLAKITNSIDDSSQSETEESRIDQLDVKLEHGHMSSDLTEQPITSGITLVSTGIDQSQVLLLSSVQSENSINPERDLNILRTVSLNETEEPLQKRNNISGRSSLVPVILDNTEHTRTHIQDFIENRVLDSTDEITDSLTIKNDESMDIESVASDEDMRKLPSLEDIYMKDTKTLNTNVLSTGLIEEEDMAIDSEKFHKVDNTGTANETHTEFAFDHLNGLMTLDSAKGHESMPYIKETNLLANVKDKFPSDCYQKKFLFSELMENETCSFNNVKRIKTEEMEEKNLKMQARMKVNTAKNPTKNLNVENPNSQLVSSEIFTECLSNSASQVGSHGDMRMEREIQIPPSRAYIKMADRAWQKHLDHNQSVIVNTFHGQFKNTVVCSECHHVSLTFEPFMYLSVPLPHAMERQISVVFMPSDNKQPIRYLVTLNKTETVQILKSHLVALIGEESCDLIIGEVLDNHIARILEDHTLLQFMNDYDRTIYAFEMLPAPDIDCPTDLDEEKLLDHDNLNTSGHLMDSSPNNMSTSNRFGSPLQHGSDNRPHVMPNSTLEISDDLEDDKRLNNSTDNIGNQSWSSEDFRSNIEYQHNLLSVVDSNAGIEVTGEGDTSAVVNMIGEGRGIDREADQSGLGVEEEGGAGDAPTVADQWKTCAICLEEMIDNDLMVHASCGGTLCHSCLEMTFKHYGAAGLTCPVCSVPVDPAIDFIQLNAMADYKPKTRILSVPVVHRLDTVGADGRVVSRLFGHPNILYLPSNTSADFLYGNVDRVVQCLTQYIIIMTDGQGLRCSRCLYTQHCSGCPLPREGSISLQPGDHLAVKFTQLSEIQIEATQRVIDDVSMQQSRGNRPLTLLECFEAFTQSEVLDEHNPWYCPKCRSNKCANKTMTVWKYPDTLVVYLKRFVFHERSSTKIDSKVVFPLEDLDLSDYISGPQTDSLKYDLQSCICHFGGVNSGHYTSYAKHLISSEWVYYNDETMSHIQPRDDDYSHAYVLFYQRQGTNRSFKLPESCSSLFDRCRSPDVTPSYPSSVTHDNRDIEASDQCHTGDIASDFLGYDFYS